MTPTDVTRNALADLDSTADALEAADLMLAAHSIRRAVRTLRAELSPAVVLDGQEDDGDPELVGERIDPAALGACPASHLDMRCNLAPLHGGRLHRDPVLGWWTRR